MRQKRILLIIVLLMGAVFTAFPQSTTHNYVESVKCTSSDGSGVKTIQYYDGLGYPDLKVHVGMTSNGKDLASLTEYDAMKRDSLEWRMLPTGTSGGIYVNNYRSAVSAYLTDYPYTWNMYEQSPDGRITEQTRPGAAWHSQQKNIRTSYAFNAESGEYAVNGYRVRNEVLAAYSYSTGTLRATKTNDEDGNVHYTFTDKWNRVVMERDSVNGTVYDTHFAYDECGNLRYVLPPAVNGDLSSDNLSAMAYSYGYDDEGRCIVRKLPGVEASETVYDTADRIVMERDGNQKDTGKWMYHTYDSFGRLSATYEVSESRSRETLAALFTSPSYSYSPTITTTLLENHYDDYSFLDTRSDKDEFLTMLDGNTSFSSQSGQGMGRLLGTVLYTLDAAPIGLWTVYQYDHRGNVVQQVSDNLRGGYDKMHNTYTYSGKPSYMCYVHSDGNGNSLTMTTAYTYNLSSDLLMSEMVSVDGTQAYSVTYTYDDLMRLQSKTITAESNITTTYSYNIRDWMTSMNNPLYSQNLTYSYGGNISTQQWTQDSKTRKYAYTYDGLDRLTSAAYTGDGNYATSYGYDRNGNIKTLQRYDVSLVDDLTLDYNGNQLTKVEDASGNTFGFADGTSTTNEYTYDGNGNLTKDLNKNISNIQYNPLNLPTVVTFSNGNTITYTYAADGRKLRTVHVIDGDTTTTDYCGNVIYENGTAKLLLVEAGYVNLTDNSYHFFIKDHLGNNRIVADANGNVEESNQYYPFGLSYANANSNLQPYKYNGKELDIKAGLNWYDYGARHYDAALGRWHVVDPLAEKYYGTSPYAYCLNNPIALVDEEGKAPIKALKALYNIGRKAYKTYQKTGKLNIKQAIKQEGLDFVDNVKTIFDSESSTFEKVIAGVDLVTGFGDEASKGAKILGIADEAASAKKNTERLRESATIGQEAHRQIEKELKDVYGADPEVTIKLPNKQIIRKDAVMPDGKLIIIKPDTPSGHKAAERRKRLLNKNGYDNIREFFYDPKDPKYQQGSPTYIGPNNK